MTACSRVEQDACLPAGLTFDSAKSAYEAKNYAEASRDFEALALGSQRCTHQKPLDPGQREFVVYEMLSAAEAAHWARNDIRARALAARAREFALAFEPTVKQDEDVEFALSGDKDQAAKDLAGTWTIGLRP